MTLQTDTDKTIICRKIRAVMLNNGVPKTALAKTLSGILQISKSHAYKKLTVEGGALFTLLQIQELEKHYGVKILESSLDELCRGGQNEDPSQRVVDATFKIAEKSLPCRVVIGDKLTRPQPEARYVAWLDEGIWTVAEVETAPRGGSLFHVNQIELITVLSAKTDQVRVAILEDERGFADNLQDYLNACGFHATAFYDVPSFYAALGKNEYSAFLLDWVIGKHTSEMIIPKIRSSQPMNAPIIIMTGGMNESANVTAAMAEKFGVEVLLKPFAMKDVRAMISDELAKTGNV